MGKQRYKPIVYVLYSWLEHYSNLRDWAAMSRGGDITSNCPNEKLEKFWNRDGSWPQPITKKAVDQHLHGRGLRETTIYFRSRDSAPIQIAAIDIDAHEDEKTGRYPTDALDLSDHLLAILPTYREQSTHFRGFHHYILIDRQGVPIRWFHRFLEVFNLALVAIRDENNFAAGVELKGRATTRFKADGKWQVESRGAAIKVPRLPLGERDGDSLLDAPTYKLVDLRRVVQTVPEHTKLLGEWIALAGEYRKVCKWCTETRRSSRLVYPEGLATDEELILAKGNEQPVVGKRSRSPNPSGVSYLANIEDAFKRMSKFCPWYSRQLGRLPTVEELLAAYETAVLGRGQLDNERRARAVSAIEWVAGTFDPDLCVSREPDWANEYRTRGTYLLAAIGKHVDASAGLKGYQRRLDDSDLAVVLLPITVTGADSIAWSQNRFVRVFQVLRTAGIGVRAGNRDKVGACLNSLTSAGLIACVNKGYIPGSRGRRYTIGPNHPDAAAGVPAARLAA